MALTTPYAKDSDLETYDSEVRKLGVDSFEKQLLLASEDILNKIKGEWWPSATTLSLSSFDEANLNTDALLQITVFKAFADYVFPMLSKFREGDIFQEKSKHYKERFKEEWATIKSLPLYDFDEDDTFEDSERKGPIERRLSRG